MRRKLLLFAILITVSHLFVFSQITPKREFRGAWMHVIHQRQYQSMNSDSMKRYLSSALDDLQSMHINAVVFQVRPTADAFYASQLEPWSRYLTGTQGKPLDDGFDPMEFMISECHNRNMEFHAWLNPYRVTSLETDTLHESHIYYRHPEWFVSYGNKLYFDPGLPESRDFICEVVKDIVGRYDVDAIHMDDYFYPYPVAGEAFPDDDSFRKYAQSQGFSAEQRDDWRRNNVNLLIEQIKQTILLTKPWVRFGISPFGIYRNKKNTPDGSGSDTNGLQNYDDLYADIKLWVEKGWIDYNLPQLYWEIGHPRADYEVLIKWWSRNNYGAHLYIGQAVSSTMRDSQLAAKMELERTLPAVYGNCFWPAYELLKNTRGVADSLRTDYQQYPALIPAYLHLHRKAPKDVKSLKAEWTPEGYKLHWKRNGDIRDPEKAQYFVIYKFEDKEKVNLEDPSKIVKITREEELLLPYSDGKRKVKYVVTSVDRFHNETKKGKSKTVKL
ncbi:MAG: family 10 glycosylhydrolase [Dysgonamonadaceae bacterium]|jgi:uncharacterized lipoprotein YddW (UPF0748 family)|nr:family 10 glycosylhydrolase [Dysgonamonadaceae bacterium]